MSSAPRPQARIFQKYHKLAEDRKRKKREQETEEEQQAFSKRRSNVPVTASGRAKSRLAEDLEKMKRSQETKADATGKETKKPKTGSGNLLHGITEAELSEWKGSMVIGQGGQGKATLFIKQDKDGNTIDKMVIKEVGEQTTGDFDDQDVWHEKWILAREVYIHHLLTANPHPILSSIVKCFGGDVKIQRRTYRVFTEFMDGGDLHQLLMRQYRTQTKFAEGTLWYFFMRLAFAALEMDNLQGVLPDGHYVVHHDLKNDNIWLGESSPKPVKIGDFGSARIMHGSGEGARRRRGIAITWGWVPPELLDTTKSLPVTSATNVFQIGKIMRSLALLEAPSSEEDEEEDSPARLHMFPDEEGEQEYDHFNLNWETEELYSQEFQDVIAGCLKWNSSNRWTPSALNDAVSKGIELHHDRQEKERERKAKEPEAEKTRKTGAEEAGAKVEGEGEGEEEEDIANSDNDREAEAEENGAGGDEREAEAEAEDNGRVKTVEFGSSIIMDDEEELEPEGAEDGEETEAVDYGSDMGMSEEEDWV